MIDWQKLASLFARLDHPTIMHLVGVSHEHRRDDCWPDRQWEDSYSGSGIGFDFQYMPGPHDHHLEGADKPTGIIDQDARIHDNIRRRKIYLQGYDIPKSTIACLPELQYFNDIRDKYKDEVSKNTKYFLDQPDIKEFVLQLMLIEYSNLNVPEGSTDKDYWVWNFDRFGHAHIDDSLGGLHLGESDEGFFVDKDGKRVYHNLTTGETLWFWGDEASASGIEPTVHGVDYINESNGKNRYSVIFNLKTER